MSDMAAVTDRLARATSVIRARAQDAVRAEHNGGSAAELRARVDAAVVEVEKAARRLTEVLT